MHRTRSLVLVPAALSAVLVGGATPARAADSVPFRGTDSGTARVVGGSGDVIRTADVASGHATHLGRYTMTAVETINVVTGAITNGSFTLTAANGDTVTGTYGGQARPGLLGYDVSGPVTGGTGRFADASGVLTWHGVYDPTAMTLSDEVVGWLSW